MEFISKEYLMSIRALGFIKGISWKWRRFIGLGDWNLLVDVVGKKGDFKKFIIPN